MSNLSMKKLQVLGSAYVCCPSFCKLLSFTVAMMTYIVAKYFKWGHKLVISDQIEDRSRIHLYMMALLSNLLFLEYPSFNVPLIVSQF